MTKYQLEDMKSQESSVIVHEGIGIGIFNDNIDENQTTTNH